MLMLGNQLNFKETISVPSHFYFYYIVLNFLLLN